MLLKLWKGHTFAAYYSVSKIITLSLSVGKKERKIRSTIYAIKLNLLNGTSVIWVYLQHSLGKNSLYAYAYILCLKEIALWSVKVVGMNYLMHFNRLNNIKLHNRKSNTSWLFVPGSKDRLWSKPGALEFHSLFM